MKATEIVVGQRYGVRLTWRDILIEDSDTTYREHLKELRERRLSGSAHFRLEEMLKRAERPPAFDESWEVGETIIVYATVVERQGPQFVIEFGHKAVSGLFDDYPAWTARARVRPQNILGEADEVLARLVREHQERKRESEARRADWKQMQEHDPVAEAERLLAGDDSEAIE